MLEFVDEMFDDIHNTKSALLRWVLESLEVYTEQEEEEIDALLHHLNRCSKLVRKVASEATVYKLMDQNILRDAALCYTHGLRTGAKSYYELYLKLKEDINSNCKDSFRRKVKGLLNVKADEHIEIGTLAGGVEDCKTLCLSEERCRAIGFVDSITITLSHRKGDVKTVKKANQCHIYFRSTNTASIYTPNGAENPAVYDRKCD
ncbi:uncharacterized protein LOC118197690 [Stegodyphus dumicola]|uniref:uncharacterized protein LOC118197690 n=1 Tax=Stegodyphus dumicola TaxID=202533 RepID=UPI0015B30E73|nr:uncharacterized protein LOC118197690 [Stegodyphus dumicola]